MKKLFLSLLVMGAGIMAASAQSAYRNETLLSDLPWGTTNSVTVDASYSSAFALSVAFTGQGDHTVTALLVLTNNPAYAAAVGIGVGANAMVVYSWTNNPTYFATNLSSPGTNLVFAITNGTVNGNSVTISINATTNIFYFTNAPVAATDVLTNTLAGFSTTNLFNALQSFYPNVALTNGVITLVGGAGNAIRESDSTIGTNLFVAYYTVSTITATNTYQMQLTNSAASATTNLYNRLLSDFPLSLNVSYTGPTNLMISSRGNGFFTVTNTVFATNSVATNGLIGNIKLLGSNSLDLVSWQPDPARNIIIPYSSNSPVVLITNWATIGGIGYYKFAVENAATNYGVPQGLQIKPGVKRGF